MSYNFEYTSILMIKNIKIFVTLAYFLILINGQGDDAQIERMMVHPEED